MSPLPHHIPGIGVPDLNLGQESEQHLQALNSQFSRCFPSLDTKRSLYYQQQQMESSPNTAMKHRETSLDASTRGQVKPNPTDSPLPTQHPDFTGLPQFGTDSSTSKLLFQFMTESMKHQQFLAPRVSNPQPQIQPNREEEIINLRVKLALAENDLKHERAAKDAMMNGFVMAIQALSASGVRQLEVPTLATPASPTEDSRVTSQLEGEVERYRKENKGLRTKLRELSGTGTPSKKHNSNDRTSTQDSPLPGCESDPDPKLDLDSKDRVVDVFVAERNVARSGPTPHELAGSWAFQQTLLQASSFGFGSSSNANLDIDTNTSISTIPNNRQSLTQASVTKIPSMNNTNNFIADIGLLSLEDMLNDNEYGPSDLVPGLEKAQEDDLPGLFNFADLDDEKDFDEQLEDQAKAMQKFNALPEPSVLKAETTVQGSFRGKEYDPTTMVNAPKGPRGWTADQNRYQNVPIFRHQRSDARDLDIENWREEGDNKNMELPNALWSSREEREDALKGHVRACTARTDTRFPDFFRYGIQYQPSDLDGNFFRTVHIENLPSDVELREVLARVRGGDVLSAVLLDTKRLMGAMSARIVFKNEGSARDFLSWTGDHALVFGEGEEMVEAKVTLIETPTFPPCPRINQKLGVSSRCICIPNFPPKLPIRSLEEDIACHSQMRREALLEIWLDEDRTLHLEFASLDMAGSATAILSSFRYYRELGLEIKYEVDPCSGSVEQLLDPVKPRPHLLPSNYLETPVHGREHIESRGSSGDDSDSLKEITKKKRPTFINTKIEIPSFSGKALGSKASWADEVEEELEADAASAAVAPSFETLKGNFHSPVELSPNNLESREGLKTGKGSMQSTNSVLAQAEHVSAAPPNVEMSNSIEFDSLGLAGSKHATQIPSFSNAASRPLLSPISPPRSPQNSAIYSPSKELNWLIAESDSESVAESATPTHRPATRNSKPGQPGFGFNPRHKPALTLRVDGNTQEKDPYLAISPLALPPSISGEFETPNSSGGSSSQVGRSVDTMGCEQTRMAAKHNTTTPTSSSLKLESSNPAFRATNMTVHNGLNPDEIALNSASDSDSDF